jgi:hypothetical protein
MIVAGHAEAFSSLIGLLASTGVRIEVMAIVPEVISARSSNLNWA